MPRLKLFPLVICASSMLIAAPAFAGTDSDSGAQQGQPPASTSATPRSETRDSAPATTSGGAARSQGDQTKTGGPSGGAPGRS